MPRHAATRKSARPEAQEPWGLFAASFVVIAAAILFGGASRENHIRLALVELTSIPLAMLALRHLIFYGAWKSAIVPLAILASIMLVPILQIVPLPPDWWPRFPGQTPRLTALGFAGLARTWRPISLYPSATLAALPALFPPTALFLAALTLSEDQARRLAPLWIGGAVAGLMLGIFQLAMPEGGPAYLYKTTNIGSVVGFFANHNHEAGFLLALMPLAVCLGGGRSERSEKESLRVRGIWLAGLYLLLAIVALGVIRSRAGVILAAPASLGSLILLWWVSPSRGARFLTIALGGVIILGVAAVALFALTPILGRFAGGLSQEFRFEAWPLVARAAVAALPFGAGLGTFDRVFRAVEPLALVARVYFNHAHNDFLELWLETGLLGGALFVAFLVWMMARMRVIKSSRDGLAAGALLAMAILLACSVVDYPLRTETLATLFAFCAGIVARSGRASAPEPPTGA
jgi:hypothetical protein